MAQALYRKWRPQRWEDVIGQNHIIQTLQNSVASGHIAHAYLFAGPRGTGKTTTARLLAKAANCLDPEAAHRPCDQCAHCLSMNQGRFLDLIEIDAASNTSVDDVRDLREKINFSPNQGRYKVYIVDEVHMLSTAAFNALLKTLEEPPPHAIFILATTEVHKIPATVLSRCQRHEFRRIPMGEMTAYLERMAKGEQLDVSPQALALIARQSTGCLRDAISLLDQLASTGEQITLEMAQQVLGTATSQSVIELIDALLAGEAARGLEHIHHALDSGSDPRMYARQIVEYLRDLLLIKMNGGSQVEAVPEMRSLMARHAAGFELSRLLNVIKVFNQAANESRTGWQPALPLEMALMQALNQEKATDMQPVSPPPGEMASGNQGSPIKSSTPKPQRPVEQEAPIVPQTEQETTAVMDEESEQLYDQLKKNWIGILKLVKEQNIHTEAMLRTGRLLGMKRGVLILGFEGALLRQKMEQGENIAVSESVISQVLSRRVPVRCIAIKDRRSEIPADVDIDGMVAAALRDLGGKIVDIQ